MSPSATGSHSSDVVRSAGFTQYLHPQAGGESGIAPWLWLETRVFSNQSSWDVNIVEIFIVKFVTSSRGLLLNYLACPSSLSEGFKENQAILGFNPERLIFAIMLPQKLPKWLRRRYCQTLWPKPWTKSKKKGNTWRRQDGVLINCLLIYEKPFCLDLQCMFSAWCMDRLWTHQGHQAGKCHAGASSPWRHFRPLSWNGWNRVVGMVGGDFQGWAVKMSLQNHYSLEWSGAPGWHELRNQHIQTDWSLWILLELDSLCFENVGQASHWNVAFPGPS